jgi:hypothetical protein
VIHPHGEPYPADRGAGPQPVDNDALPDSPAEVRPRKRWRDLPRAERVRLKVEDTVRYYAQTHKKILTVETIGQYIGWKVRTVGPVSAAEITTALSDPVTIANLRDLGILPDDVLSWDEALEARVRPDGVQMDVLDSIFEQVNPGDERPLEVILREHGVELKTWNGWLADPMFAGYVRSRTASVFGERAHEVDIALLRRATAGDVSAVKLILQLQGRLTDTRAIDAGQLLGRVLEILLEEVADQALLERIGRRFEALSQQAARGALPAAVPTVPAPLEAQLLAGLPRQTIIEGEQ